MAAHRYKRLDSLRGIAALSVGVGHAVLCVYFSTGSAWRYGILGVFNANYAVDMFFVLSGFVLTNMVSGFSAVDYGAYLGRRLMRLYPVLWASLIVGYVACVAVSAQGLPCTAMSAWICHFIRAPASAVDFARSIVPGGSYGLDPVLWTIRIEIEASLAYPMLLFLWRKADVLGKAVLAIAAVALSFISESGLSHYLFLFLIGIAITDLRALPYPKLCAAVSVALMAVSGFLVRGHSTPADLICGASAAMLIAVVIHACPRWLGKLLDNRAILKLGELSYPYYLLNPIILWCIAREAAAPLSRMLGGDLRAVLVSAILAVSAGLATWLISYAENLTVEKPSITGSRVIERWILDLRGKDVVRA